MKGLYPERIHKLISSAVSSDVLIGIKTLYKPNATLPFLWFIVHREGILFCCTHKTRGIYKHYKPEDIDSFRISNTSNSITILHVNLDAEDFEFTLPKENSPNEIKNILENIGYQVI